MSRLDKRRREVMPSKEISGKRRGAPSFGPKMGVSVPISIGLPFLIVGAFIVFTAVATDRTYLFIGGGAAMVLGAVLMATGKRL
jgi:hypothetical protein